MRYQTQYMNELMNRDYGMDIDEDELDQEMRNIDDQYFSEVLEKDL